MGLSTPISLDPTSFFYGFVIAAIFWWVVAQVGLIWREIGKKFVKNREELQPGNESSVEQNHRRLTLQRAQGMHLAAALFALDEILELPRLLAPPPRIEPGGPGAPTDAVSLTLPYLPAWPELAAIYNAPTITPGQALSGGTNLVIIGQPGVGKTVALAHLASLAAKRDGSLGSLKDAVPFLLHVADLKLPSDAIEDVLGRFTEMISESTALLELGKVSGFVEGVFNSGRALLLLDGFDELTSESQKDVSNYLRVLLQQYPMTRVITTGAPDSLDGLLSLGFIPLALAAWNQPREAHFIRLWSQVWMKYIAVEAAEQTPSGQPDPLLLSIWLRSENQFLTPFELTLKVWSAYAGDSLGPEIPDSIASHLRRLVPANVSIVALETLAMQVTLTGQPIFDARKAHEWMKGVDMQEEVGSENEFISPEISNHPWSAKEDTASGKKAPKKVTSSTQGLLDRLASTGLIISYSNNRARFAHPIFGGYLAGRAFTRYRADEVLVNQPDWVGKLLAMRFLASQGDVAGLIKILLESSRLPMHRPMLTAARWLRDAPRTAVWRSTLMSALMDLLQTEGLPLSLRGQVVAALVVSGDPDVPGFFRQYINSVSFELVNLVSLGSGAVKDTNAIKILEGILQGPSISTRRAACLALVAIGSTEALESVANTLLNGDEELRRVAAEALANDPIEGHAMLKDGVMMPDVQLRKAVVYGLGRVDEKWAVELLEKMRTDDDQWIVRKSASEVMEARSMDNDPRIPRPLKSPSESGWLTEFANTQGIAISPNASATDVLIRALKSSKADERLAALEYLKHNPSDGIIKSIYSAMYGGEITLREAAYITLWEIGATGYKLPHPTQFGYN